MRVLAPPSRAKATFTWFLAFLIAMAPLRADPCGLVPPINALAGAIQRTGVQTTYVFFRDGIASIVLRPGFTGSVDEFGMLIPFPSPPSVRKVADDVFEQIAAAIDPPQVTVGKEYRGPGSAVPGGPASAGPGLGFNAVRLLRQEAVGMYEVAVLEAGSARALARWMQAHGYRYPDGMDEVCEEYVALGWCFVAVKTRVGSQAAVAPRPGMRAVDARLPAGARFDGSVQAMGFRFRCARLEVPMRLSTFNGGDARNIVYALTDGPVRIRNLPPNFVKRQISGRRLWQNLTQPLDIRVVGGTVHDLTVQEIDVLAARRDPARYNAVAKELFLSDVEAARRQRLTHPSEDVHTRLLRIGEELGLRGKEIDTLIEAEVAQRRHVEVADVRRLRDMTMTVIDGDFSREILARENLALVPFRMRAERNVPDRYDARQLGPRQRRGIVPVAVDGRRPPPVGTILFVLGAAAWLTRRATRARRPSTPPAAAPRRAAPSS